jgi:hypothetical protein
MEFLLTATFRTSAYGRLGHLVMAVPCLFASLLTGAGLLYRVVKIDDAVVWIGAVVIFLISTWILCYCIYFVFERGNRVVCSNEELAYRGFITSVAIPWSTITEIRIDFNGRLPFVFLVLRTTNRRWPYRLNVSGIRPTYVTIFALLRKMAPTAKAWGPRGYSLVEETNGTWINTFAEDRVANPLTLVRLDADEGPHRSKKP